MQQSTSPDLGHRMLQAMEDALHKGASKVHQTWQPPSLLFWVAEPLQMACKSPVHLLCFDLTRCGLYNFGGSIRQ